MKKAIYFGLACLVLLSCIGMGSAYKAPVYYSVGIGSTHITGIGYGEVTEIEQSTIEPGIEIDSIKPGCCSSPIGIIELLLEE